MFFTNSQGQAKVILQYSAKFPEYLSRTANSDIWHDVIHSISTVLFIYLTKKHVFPNLKVQTLLLYELETNVSVRN